MNFNDSVNQQAVELFQERCGIDEGFPRDIERRVSKGLPVNIVKLPHLTLQRVEQWLSSRGPRFSFMCHSRAVRGCVVAFNGHGVIFIDNSDPIDEQRFTVAHETAHFIVDYWLPRRRAVNKLGEGIAQVFDGERSASVDERFDALIAGVRVGVYTEMMERDSGSSIASVWDVEDRADCVATALLAPAEDVLAETDIHVESSFDDRVRVITRTLDERFGLPGCVAQPYGRFLLESIGRGPSWVESLGLR